MNGSERIYGYDMWESISNSNSYISDHYKCVDLYCQ